MAERVGLSERKSRLSAAKRALLEKRLRGEITSAAGVHTIPLRTKRESIPLSFAQERLWFLDQLEPNSSLYNLSKAVRLKGTLNIEALQQALSLIVSRHEALRTTFVSVNGSPVQVIAEDWLVELPVIDLSRWPEAEQETEVQRLLREHIQRPFNLTSDLMLRATLLRLGREKHILLLVMHHIASDAWSRGVLFRELSALYEVFSTGNCSPLPDLPIQYADFAVWQRGWLQEDILTAQLGYWREQLEGAPSVLELPTDYPRPAVQSHRGAMQSLTLSKALTEALKDLSQQEGATLFMTLLAAFKVLLHRYSGHEDIVIGTPIANRTRAEVERLIGFFINTLVLRTSLSGNPSFRELLGRVREVAVGAYAHQDLPFEKLLEELQPQRNLSRTPLFQAYFNMQSFEDQTLELRALTVENLPPTELDSLFDLTLYVRELSEEIHLRLVYDADLFCQDRMVEMLQQFSYLLSQVVANPEERITRFSLVTSTARECLPSTTQPLSSEWVGAVHRRFSQQAQKFPKRLAVTDTQEKWTYQSLNARSNQLANHLIANGIGPQDVVAIYSHRSAALVLAVLGVLKAGAAFLILDPAYPASRLSQYLCQAQPQGWIQLEAAGDLPEALEACVAALSCRCRLVLPQRLTQTVRGPLNKYSIDDPNITVGPDDLAYIAFTSGSTGQPKGILGRHGPLSHFLPWQADVFDLTASDRFSMLSGLSHDPLQRDMFTPLWVGATICIPAPDFLDKPGQLADWMAQEKITFTHLTPAMGQILTESVRSGRPLSSLRYAFFVGDKLTRRDVARLRRLAPGVTCINSYGSTETQRAVGYYIVPATPQDGWSKAVYPLGRGMPNVQLLVLNAEQQLAGVGEVGEVYVRSPHLAKGYLANEALTQAHFLANPFTGADGGRMYKTGDLGRYLPDGRVEFAGRNDQQVKMRGFRIELGEIEAVLGGHPRVRETVVLARDDLPDDSRLVAYIVPNQQAADVRELRHFLGQKLPGYMIPSAFVMLDTLPLTPNGKINRRALPAPDTARPELERAPITPRDTLELQLVKIWEQVLGTQPIGVRDNFFELGGHSLLGVRLFAQINEEFGKELPLATLYQTPTVEHLAEVLRQSQTGRTAPGPSLVAMQPAGSSPPFFCIPGNMGNVFTDLGGLAQYLGQDQPFYGLQDGTHNPFRIETLATRYLDEIQAVQPQGPYFLGGVCWGGTVAFELAQQLQTQGQQVALLALVEPSPPRLGGLRSYLKLAVSTLNRFLRRFGRHSRRLTQPISREQGAYLGLKAKVIANLWALRRYTPRPYPGRIHLFLTDGSLSSPHSPRRDWRALAVGGAEIHKIPGTHDTITGMNDTQIEEAHMQALAERLRASIDGVLTQA